MNFPLIAAGLLALLAAAVHGVAGERLVVSKLAPSTLPTSRFGGPRATRSMIQVTWHITTIAFFTVGAALLVAGAALDGDAARAVALVAAAAATGFAAVTVGIGGAGRPPRALLAHPAPAVLTATAVLAWVGAL
jgi:hypothetical protein